MFDIDKNILRTIIFFGLALFFVLGIWDFIEMGDPSLLIIVLLTILTLISRSIIEKGYFNDVYFSKFINKYALYIFSLLIIATICSLLLIRGKGDFGVSFWHSMLIFNQSKCIYQLIKERITLKE